MSLTDYLKLRSFIRKGSTPVSLSPYVHAVKCPQVYLVRSREVLWVSTAVSGVVLAAALEECPAAKGWV